MGSSPSKPQYYDPPQGGYPAQLAYPYSTLQLQEQEQGQFGYYYQQVGNDPTNVQIIPGYYYPANGKRRTHRRHASAPLPTPPRTNDNSNDQPSAAPVTSSIPTAAADDNPVETGEPPADPADPEPPQQSHEDVPPETAAAPPAAHGDEQGAPTTRPEPAPEPARAAGLPNPPAQLSQDGAETDRYRRVKRAHTTGNSWQYYNGPIAATSYKPARSQYVPARTETLRPPRPHEELKRQFVQEQRERQQHKEHQQRKEHKQHKEHPELQQKKSSSIGRGAFKLLRSFTMPLEKTKKSQDLSPPSGMAYGHASSSYGSKAISAPPLVSGPPILITNESPFYPTSAHKILYKKKLYPTAAHLFEAHKFMKQYPELAERIRMTGDNIRAMSKMSRKFEAEGKAVKDWPLMFKEKMDEVIYMKFTQHPDLRAELMATGYGPFIDGHDLRHPDAEGGNEFGKALGRVRDRLRREGAR